MFEVKIIISYIVVCLTYTLCRMHYLLTVEKDSELSKGLGQLVDYAGSESIVKVVIILQILFSPILAPVSVIKHTYNFICGKKIR